MARSSQVQRVLAAIDQLNNRDDLEAVIDAALRRLPATVDEPAPPSAASKWAAASEQRKQDIDRVCRESRRQQMAQRRGSLTL